MNILQTLKLENKNLGTSTGSWWSQNKEKGEIVSYNPTDGTAIASVFRSHQDDYESVLASSGEAFLKWCQVPAPKRGEVIHAIGLELRKHKDALGSLVSLEMGKSKQEGDGEVQEMIDMADLAV